MAGETASRALPMPLPDPRAHVGLSRAACGRSRAARCEGPGGQDERLGQAGGVHPGELGEDEADPAAWSGRGPLLGGQPFERVAAADAQRIIGGRPDAFERLGEAACTAPLAAPSSACTNARTSR